MVLAWLSACRQRVLSKTDAKAVRDTGKNKDANSSKTVVDYSGAVKPLVRRTGNRPSGMRKPLVNSSGAAAPPVRCSESHLSGTDGATCNVVA